MTKVIALALVLGCLLSWQRRHDHSPRHGGEWAGKGWRPISKHDALGSEVLR